MLHVFFLCYTGCRRRTTCLEKLFFFSLFYLLWHCFPRFYLPHNTTNLDLDVVTSILEDIGLWSSIIRSEISLDTVKSSTIRSYFIYTIKEHIQVICMTSCRFITSFLWLRFQRLGVVCTTKTYGRF